MESRTLIRPLLSGRNIFVFVLCLVMFGLGAAVHKYKPFPYGALHHQLNVMPDRLGWSISDRKSLLSQQYAKDNVRISLERDIDTVLLPLKLRGVRLSEHYPVPKTAGGITAVGNVVVILDRLGNIYSSERAGGALTKLPFPPIPSNIDGYIKFTKYNVDERKFRAHHIKYLESSKLLAVSHEYFDEQNKKTRLAVSVIGIDDKPIRAVGSWRTIYLSDLEPGEPNENAGGSLARAGQDRIYLTVGDYASPKLAQDPQSSFGKIAEISISDQKVKVLSKGHRNPQGLAILRSGELWSTEHGPLGGDELNHIIEGANYGWPDVTLGTNYGEYHWSAKGPVGDHTGYAAPKFAWLPSIGVSNLIQVEGFDPRWDGDLLVASLKARMLFRLRLDKDRVLYSEPIHIGQRIRDITQLQNGTVVLWTDDTQLLYLSVDQQKLESKKRLARPVSETLSASCMYCHHLGPTSVSDFAPSLENLFERKIGSDNFAYTPSLRNKESKWTEASLREFLSDPGKFASGTSMPKLDLDQEAIEQIIADLKNANGRQ
jgi:cytochrome c2